MPGRIEELDRRQTSMGELTLLKRQASGREATIIYEVRLDEAFLMSSLVNESEIALAEIPLSNLAQGDCDVLVGGLGLGYTARAALDAPNVQSVTVVESIAAVIEWHRQGLVPLGRTLTDDPRCRFIHADVFLLLASGETEGPPSLPVQAYDAILVDIDHSPHALLHPSHAPFYELEGLRHLSGRIVPGGVFALWSADPPDDAFLTRLKTVFPEVRTHPVHFFHPLIETDDTNWIYIARRGA